MKKLIFLFIALVCVLSVSAQVTTSVDQSFFDIVYNFVVGYIPVKTLLVITTIAWVFEQILPAIKWIPANNTLRIFWDGLLFVIKFLALKKK